MTLLLVTTFLLLGVQKWELNNAIVEYWFSSPLVVAPESLVANGLSGLMPNAPYNETTKNGEGTRLVMDRREWLRVFRVAMAQSSHEQWLDAYLACMDRESCWLQNLNLSDAVSQRNFVPAGWSQKEHPIDRAFLHRQHLSFTRPFDAGSFVFSLVLLVLSLSIQLYLSFSACLAWNQWRESRAQNPAQQLVEAFRCFAVLAAQVLCASTLDCVLILASQHVPPHNEPLSLGIVLFSMVLPLWVGYWGRCTLERSIPEAKLAKAEARIAHGTPVLERQQLAKAVSGPSTKVSDTEPPTRRSRRL